MLRAPCKQCEKRQIGCHKHCRDYQEYRETRNLIVRSRHESNESEYEYQMVTRKHLRG